MNHMSAITVWPINPGIARHGQLLTGISPWPVGCHIVTALCKSRYPLIRNKRTFRDIVQHVTYLFRQCQVSIDFPFRHGTQWKQSILQPVFITRVAILQYGQGIGQVKTIVVCHGCRKPPILVRIVCSQYGGFNQAQHSRRQCLPTAHSVIP